MLRLWQWRLPSHAVPVAHSARSNKQRGRNDWGAAPLSLVVNMDTMPLPRIDRERGRAAVASIRDGSADRDTTAVAVRFILQEFARIAPGKSVEVRVPPHGAVQIVEGLGHTRGTPPNVIELDAATLVALAVGDESWDAAIDRGAVRASGTRASLAELVPLSALRE